MSRFRVVPSDLYTAAKNLTDQAERFSEASEGTNSAANHLCSTWEGNARNAFQSEQAQTHKLYMQMADNMRLYANGLSTMAQKYEEADARAAALLSST